MLLRWVFLTTGPDLTFISSFSATGECEGSCSEIGSAEIINNTCIASAPAVPGPWSDWGERGYRRVITAGSRVWELGFIEAQKARIFKNHQEF